MRDDRSARLALRWWDTLRPAERIVAMSLLAGGTIAIINSTVWAVAVCYMARQRTLATIARAERRSLAADEPPLVTVGAINPGRGPREQAGGAE